MSNVSREVLLGFVEEAGSYLPEILDGIKAFRKSSDNVDGLETAYRHAHTIKGAAAMIGESALSHIAYYLEEMLEDVAGSEIELNDDAMRYVRSTISHVELYLVGLIDDNVNSRRLLTVATRENRELRGLATDAVAVEAAVEEAVTLAEETVEAAPPLGLFDDTADFADANSAEMEPLFVLDDAFMAELREAFNEEANDHLQNTARLLATLEKDPTNRAALSELRRVIHTLKGASATVGLQPIAALSHLMEDLLDHFDESGSTVSKGVMNLLYDSADALEDEMNESFSAEKMQALLARYETIANKGGQPIAPAAEISRAPVQAAPPAPAAPKKEREDSESESAEPAAAPRTTSEVVRVPLERLDELVRLTSEFVITRTTLEQRINDLTRLVNELAPSLDRVQRIAGRLDSDYHDLSVSMGINRSSGIIPSDGASVSGFTPNEFDSLEFDRYTELYMLSRELTETSSDIKTVHNGLRTLLGDFDSIMTRQGRLSGEVQDKLMRTRMVPLATIVTRLQRTVRVVARQQSKQVDFTIIGEHIEFDKKVLEEIADPLLHILRNAVDHGIEPAELRQVTGKAQNGSITVRAFHEGNQVVVEIVDDGAGIDINRIRAKALANGYISEAEVESTSDAELQQLIFVPGFSTASEISNISGRGVGMDIVKDAVTKLQGTIQVRSRPAQGTTFTIRLPLTLAVIRGLLVNTRGTTYALPMSSVGQILRLEGETLHQIGRNPVVRVGDDVCPVIQLGDLLGLPESGLSGRKRIPALVINADDRQVALVVDEIIEGREIVIKTLGNHLRKVHGVTGATLMGDGKVVLILNPSELVQAPEQRRQRTWTPVATKKPEKQTLDIFVVDDSLSVRKVVSNMVKNSGMNPIVARDGQEALELIQSRPNLPDAILLDIEMPRMNGYELTATLRGNPKYAAIPIVMLTSRAGDKHRKKAFDLGVNGYLVKPYRESDLLGELKRVTGQVTV
ncbi:MAG: response regulator [Candidatus Promineifilaceae bacterium]